MFTDETRKLVKEVMRRLPDEAFYWPPVKINTGLKAPKTIHAYFAGIDMGNSNEDYCCLIYHEPMITGDTFVKIVPWPEKNILDRCWDWFRGLFNKKGRIK